MSRHASYNQKKRKKKEERTSASCVFLFLFFFCLWLVVFQWTMCPWLPWRGFFNREGANAYLTSSVSMVYCICRFRCLYFTHFTLQFREAVEQIANCWAKESCLLSYCEAFRPHSVYKEHVFGYHTRLKYISVTLNTKVKCLMNC